MRSVRILAIILALGGVVRAQQIQSTDVDLRQKNREFSFSAAEVTTPILRAYIRQNGSPYTSLTNLGGIFYFASNATDEIGMAVTNTASGRDYLEWTLTVDQTAVPGTYFAQIIVTNSTGSIQEWVRGEYEILDSPGTTALLSWYWNASNFATVAWVEAQLAGIQGDLSNAVSRTEFLNTNALVIGRIEVLDTGKVSVATWQGTNTLLKAEIAAAANLANMGGDISGKSTNATVVKIRNVAVAALSPGEEEDGYGLKYDHATQTLLLGPVATEGGSSISNILRLSGTAVVTDVSVTNIGVYRIIRPGDLPSMALNVGGYEAAYVDLLGITLKAGSLHLLSDVLAVNPAAYDGTVAVPAYSWDDDRDLGKYRMSYNGDYGEGYCVNSNLVWFWAADGLHLTNGAALFGLDYVAAWAAGTGLTNSGTAASPTGSLDAATQASLLLANSAVQPAQASAVSNLVNAVAASAAHKSSNTTFTAGVAIGRGFAGALQSVLGLAGGYASAHDIIASNDACIAWGRAHAGPIVAGGHVTGPAFALGNNVQAVSTHPDNPSFALGRGVTNSGYDSFVWSAGSGKYTNDRNGVFILIPSNSVEIVGNLGVSGYTVCPTQYYSFVSDTNWIGSWADYAGHYIGCNSNGTLRVLTNSWGW